MKRFINNLFLLSLLFIPIIALTGCGEDNHMHTWGLWNAINDTKCEHVCDCCVTETQFHNFVDGQCSNCNYHKGTEGLEYTLKYSNSQEYYTLSNIGTMTDSRIIIPAFINGLPVKEISDGVFENSNITSILIPDSVITIGQSAFKNSSSLRYITLGKNITKIEGQAFYGCNNLSLVYYNGNIENWCNIAFSNSSANPFCFASHLYINNEEVKNLVIPNTVTKINNYAFYNLISLETVKILNSVLEIGDYAFYNCSKVINVEFDSNLLHIGERAFQYCKMPNLIIPDTVVSIDDYAFYNCIKLLYVTIGNSVSRIGNNIFGNCDKLIEIYNKTNNELPYINQSVKNIYTPQEGKSKIDIVDDFVFYLDNTNNYLIECLEDKSEITLPDYYKGMNYEIYQKAFKFEDGLTKLEIGEGVTAVGDEAFEYCHSLKTLIVGKNVKSFGDSSFWLCNKTIDIYYNGKIEDWCNINLSKTHLKGFNLYIDYTFVEDLVIPESVSIINEGAFQYCKSIQSLTLTKSIKRIELNAFWDCMNLKSITFNGTIEDWRKIYLQPNWKGNTPISVVKCIDGDVSI